MFDFLLNLFFNSKHFLWLSQECWAHSISEKFRNERRNITDIPEVVIRKKKLRLSQNAEETVNIYGLPMFLPSRPEGEDDETIAAHVKWMQAESVKSIMNSNKIVQLMDATFADRREKIITNKFTMDEMKESYPLLYSANEVNLQFIGKLQQICMKILIDEILH